MCLPLLIFLALASSLGAGQRLVEIAWNKNPEPDVVRYEVFRGIDRITEATTNRATVTIPFSECLLTVRAVNGGGLISAMSLPLRVPSVWSEIKVSLEFSEDLKSWENAFTPAARFARAKILYPE